MELDSLNILPIIVYFKDGQYKAVATAPGVGHNEKEHEFTVSLSNPSNMRVTYTWENMEVYINIPQGNPISRLCKKIPPVQKKILSNGISSTLSHSCLSC